MTCFWVLAAALTLAGCAEGVGDDDAAPAVPTDAHSDTDTARPDIDDDEADQAETDEPQPEQFTIAGTGDMLLHGPIIDEAAALADGADYSFAPLMGGVEDLISGADLALCGLEVPIAPEGVEPAGYPVFAAPPELAGDLASVGFHGCSTANNHSFDQGTAGQERTLDVFDDAGLGHAGTARTEAEAAQPQLYTLERGGQEVTVAHVATTMLHNQAYPPPEDELWRVADVTPEELTDQAAQAREDGADVVVASVHWGEEYVHQPAEEQRDYGEQLAAGGEIDVVFGSHSHTPQPLEHLEGGPSGEGMWVVWSMGNFLSNQDEACCIPETASGTVVYATVEVSDEDAEVISMDWLPVTVDRGPTDDEPHRGIWPLRDLAEGNIPPGVELSAETVEDRWSRVLDVMTEQELREDPPSPTGEEPTVVPRRD
ncbi:CapA family protein [Nesterenkonia sp. LB17]|uniref:CapA family protein n=1 Tax=unclassified Nesterenkonia TaxID=2629769 RepID=UPI001F4CE68B|nr:MULTISPECIES: CapA family protein [unclassified Nesterenkonia]MCH8561774.1 CapA family protein [Nesterenkonia sp. YGD6]MCH8564697.1 CapA family protein [Nesterenkonia sp. LB17]